MEGFYFFWFAWIFWVILTFFFPKKKLRMQATVGILGLIIFSSVTTDFLSFEVGISCLLLQVYGYYQLRNEPLYSLLYLCIITWLLSASYATFHFLEVFDPVMLLVERSWLLGSIMAIMLLILGAKKERRVAVLFLGLAQGEWLTGLGFRYAFHERVIGGLMFLDVLAIAICLVSIWYGMEWLANRLALFIEREQSMKPNKSA
ncbi:YphA family membrane protein [Halalkalibacterium ligniniphilum]|uniref:YphA family membrane protein n=1 Tax=Halalkalibacterium ligniniphilum TaxID=1134413 RepID=UPI00034DB8D1|nr:hypothetical protein [Halalkalibacterium ligniniphilum]